MKLFKPLAIIIIVYAVAIVIVVFSTELGDNSQREAYQRCLDLQRGGLDIGCIDKASNSRRAWIELATVLTVVFGIIYVIRARKADNANSRN